VAPVANRAGRQPVSAHLVEALLERRFAGSSWDVSLLDLRVGSAVCH
jgi:hypothetical protein